jgi:hypothetical protein
MESRQPDREEKILRFGCGFLMGALIAFVAGFSSAAIDGFGWISFIVASAIVFGVLALLFGDRFWHHLFGLFRWWQ